MPISWKSSHRICSRLRCIKCRGGGGGVGSVQYASLLLSGCWQPGKPGQPGGGFPLAVAHCQVRVACNCVARSGPARLLLCHCLPSVPSLSNPPLSALSPLLSLLIVVDINNRLFFLFFSLILSHHPPLYHRHRLHPARYPVVVVTLSTNLSYPPLSLASIHNNGFGQEGPGHSHDF